MNHKNWFIILTAILSTLLLSSAMLAITPAPKPAEALDAAMGSSGQLTRAMRNWEYVNHNEFGTNYNPQTVINRDNVQYLELEWMYPYAPWHAYTGFPASGTSGSMTPPLVVDGIVYVTTNERDIIALDANDGSQIWQARRDFDLDAFEAVNTHVKPKYFVLGHTHAMNYYRDLGVVMMSPWYCEIVGRNALTGDETINVKDTCGTPEEATAWGNQGLYAGGGSHPPAVFGNIVISVEGPAISWGGRSYVSGYDVNTGARLWQTFITPPGKPLAPDNDWALHNCDVGWFFDAPKWYAGGDIATKCSDVDLDVLRGDWLATQDDDFAAVKKGEMQTANTVTNIWGHYPVDPETGIVYLGTGENAPWGNSTHHPGPNLYADSIIAIQAKTGEMVWWFQSGPHDHWDWDCSWNTQLSNIGSRKVVFKACKNGVFFALDAATGEPIWAHDMGGPPGTCTKEIMAVEGNYCAGGMKRAKWATMDWLNPRSKESMTKPWANWPDTAAYQQSTGGAGIEMDTACDEYRCYMAGTNIPIWLDVGPVYPGDQGGKKPVRTPIDPTNSTIDVVDKATGELLWSYFLPFPHRGGLTISGGVLFATAGDGNLYMFNSETGEVISKKFIGNSLFTQATIAADANGDMKVFIQTSKGSFGRTGRNVPGALMAFGLSDDVKTIVEERIVERRVNVPGPERVEVVEVEREVIREVNVPVEIIKEVPIDRIVEKEVIKEVPVEVQIVTTEEVISPLSYVAIGLGVVLIVISGVLFARKRTA